MVPWTTIDRLALLAGEFPRVDHQVSEAELVQDLAAGFASPEFLSSARDRDWWHAFYEHGAGGWTWHGCECKTHPPRVRLGGRVLAGYSELGTPLESEAGLGWAPGLNLSLEPMLDWAAGPWWASVTGRFAGRVVQGGESFDSDSTHPLTWPGWSIPTGRGQVRDSRLRGDAWVARVPRLMGGVQLGGWGLSAGWSPRRTGPGLDEALVLDDSGVAFPAVTARRTRRWDWDGFMGRLAPHDFMLRTGRLSQREVYYTDEWGQHLKEARPWFFQWLIGWEVFPWLRTVLTHTAMATAREGTLWPDLLQINFPVIGTTWREAASGPVTDRIFAIQLEMRWRDSPVPLLPSAAGRVWWDYGGTDFLPSGPGGVIPEISIPASVAGIELIGDQVDLAFEYAELFHENALWYSNGGYPEGYSQQQWLLGASLGGSGESVMLMARLRPGSLAQEAEVRIRRARWGHEYSTPGTGELMTVAVTVRNRPGAGGLPTLLYDDEGRPRLPRRSRWEGTLEWNREEADRNAFGSTNLPGASAVSDWWRVYVKWSP